jgi:RNA polymerase sigma-70 factor (ECF subfamily)
MSDDEESDSDAILNNISYEELLACVQDLSPAYRQVFNMYVVDGFSHQDIADALNISVGTSKSNLSKAKVNLKKILTDKIAMVSKR